MLFVCQTCFTFHFGLSMRRFVSSVFPCEFIRPKRDELRCKIVNQFSFYLFIITTGRSQIDFGYPAMPSAILRVGNNESNQWKYDVVIYSRYARHAPATMIFHFGDGHDGASEPSEPQWMTRWPQNDPPGPRKPRGHARSRPGCTRECNPRKSVSKSRKKKKHRTGMSI